MISHKPWPGTTLYLAGPMRGYEKWNFPAFDRYAELLRQKSYRVVSPAELDRDAGFSEDVETLPEGFMMAAMRRDIEALLKVDAVALMPGWGHSSGVKTELVVAKALGLAAFEIDNRGADGVSLLPGNVLDWFDPAVRPSGGWGESIKFMSGTNMQDALKELEVEYTDPTSGGRKGTKLARYDLIPTSPLRQLAEHYGKGAEKYADRNWELGTDWHLNYAALMRHATQFWAGEDLDEETGSPHMAAVAWHAFALLEFMTTHPELDDRPKGE